MTKEIGFTLVEVMVTLLILSILLTIAVPSFTHMKRHHEANGETNRILSLLALARSEAIKKSQVVYTHGLHPVAQWYLQTMPSR